MKKLAATIIALMAAAPAMAADLATRPVYTKAPMLSPMFNWAGFYAGVHLGGAWASRNFSDSLLGVGQEAGTLKNSSILGGGQIGYNFIANPNLLLGIEADASGTGLSASTTTAAPNGVLSTWNDKLQAIGTVRGRVGLINNNWLFYGTGGFAWGIDQFSRTQGAVAGLDLANTSRSNNTTPTGWAAGGGIEWGFARNWAARLEYLHYDLGSTSFAFAGNGGATINVNQNRLTVDAVRAGVSYLFN